MKEKIPKSLKEGVKSMESKPFTTPTQPHTPGSGDLQNVAWLGSSGSVLEFSAWERLQTLCSGLNLQELGNLYTRRKGKD
jgi:hypothetical protein